MTTPYQCINCGHLGRCKETSIEKILASYCCERWKEVEPAVYAARLEVFKLFGREGLKAIISKEMEED